MKEIIYDIIRTEKRHEHYEYVCKRTKAWRAIVSGKGIDEYFTQFNPRETDDQFGQRKRLTQQITSAVCKNVRDVEYKVPRSNGIQRVVAVEQESKKEDFQQILDEFWGDSSLNDYVDTRWIELNDTDPNSFIVTEWQPFEENEYASPYPYEVACEEAVYYEYLNNKLQFLIARTEKDDLAVYTGYFKDLTLIVTELPEEAGKLLNIEEGQELTTLEGTYIKIENKVYQLIEPEPHQLGYVPAYQPGYMRDLATNGHTFLPPWWAAESVLMNLIKSKSELDLTVSLHVFPQKWQYVPDCKHQGCTSGTMPDGSICPKCKGTGYEVHTSSQDAIYIALPRRGHQDELFDLKTLVNYVYPPIDLVKFMDEYVDKLSQKAMQFVYNSEIYSRKQVAETATGEEIDMQAVYDTLYPMAKAMSRDWEFMVETLGDITGIEVTASFTFSKDFKMKSLDGYYQDLVTLGDASAFVKSNIEDDIARIVYADNPEALAKHFTQKAFFPFPGDAPETIALKMAQRYVPDYQKVLYSNFSYIFDELASENPGFYNFTFAKQKELVKQKVAAMMPVNNPPVFPVETAEE